MKPHTTFERSTRPRSRPHRALIGVAAMVAAGTVSGSVSAATLDGGRYQFSGSQPVDWCLGIDLEHAWDVSGSFHFVASGPDRLPRYRDNQRGLRRYTNLATGRSLTVQWQNNARDLAVRDNGDGTLVVLVQASGGERWTDADGKLVLANPGLVRFEIVIDHGGTPNDPTDDEFVEELGLVKGSTGRNDTEGRDFCADVAVFTA